jgi:hypothetical protein
VDPTCNLELLVYDEGNIIVLLINHHDFIVNPQLRNLMKHQVHPPLVVDVVVKAQLGLGRELGQLPVEPIVAPRPVHDVAQLAGVKADTPSFCEHPGVNHRD